MSDNVRFKQNRKPLPHFISLGLFLLILGAICALGLALVNSITKEKIEENELKASLEENNQIVDMLLSLDSLTCTNKEEVVLLEFEDDFLLNRSDVKILNVFKTVNGTNPCYAFKCELTNNYATFNTLIVLEVNGSDTTINYVKVLDTKGKEPTSFGAATNAKFYDSEFNMFGSNAKVEDGNVNVENDFEIIAGATYTSKSVKLAVYASIWQLDKILNNPVTGGIE